MLRTLLLLSLSFVVWSGCRAQPAISGILEPKAGWKPVVYLVQPRGFSDIASNYGGRVIDSSAIGGDGAFSFSRLTVPAVPGLFFLVVQPQTGRFANQLLDSVPSAANYLPLVLENGQGVRVRAAQDRLQASAHFEGALTSANQALLQLVSLRHQAYRAAYSDASREQDTADHADDTALLHAAARRTAFQQPLLAFADTVTQLWPALLAVRWVSPEGDYERVPEALARACQRWGQAPSGSPQEAPSDSPKGGGAAPSNSPQGGEAIKELCRLASAGRLPVLLGDTLPNAALPMATGDTVNLYALLGRRLTLVDLWASWCGPCRRENREVLAPLWVRYRMQGFTVVGYALDSSPAAWQAAIRKDGAAWPQASHLQGDSSPFLDALRITTIPANYLVDARGRVLARNLHGEALRLWVEQYLE